MTTGSAPPCAAPRATALASALLGALLLLAGCGGGGGDDPPTPPEPALARLASGPSPIDPACTGGSNGTAYVHSEVEPWAAVDPTRPNRLLAAWQQDRWSNGGAKALMTALSQDGGATWSRTLQPMSRCGGAVAGSDGDFARATDPWVDFGPDGTAHLMGLAFTGGALQPGSSSAMLASRSTDGGATWSAPVALIRDGASFFNDKNSLTADPLDARFVYATWDRLDQAGGGPAMLARSQDGGVTWEAARAIYTPSVAGGVSQVLGVRIVVPTAGPAAGMLVNVFTQIDTVNGVARPRVALVRSADRGSTWSAPVFIDELRSVGTRDAASGLRIRDGNLLAQVAAGPDGTLWVTWQDARFSGGVRDAIALSRSTDGGLTWSAPVAVNRAADAPAFTPALHVRADGLLALMHFDLRTNTADPATLPTSSWLLTSRDGVVWTERPVLAAFDIAFAPEANGRFIGDYQGLVSSAGAIVAVLASARAEAGNPTDVSAPRFEGLAAGPRESNRAQRSATVGAHTIRHAQGLAAWPAAGAEQRAVHDATVAAMERRLPGWSRRAGLAPRER